MDGRRAMLNTPEVIFEASRSGIELVERSGIRAAANTPVVTFDASRFGISDAANALKVGVPDDPDGAAKIVPVACETKVQWLFPRR